MDGMNKVNGGIEVKQYEIIKKEINDCESAMEMSGYLTGINAAAIIYCKQNYPDEVYVTECGESKVTVYGMACFLEREL